MESPIRQVVTGHDKKGNAVFVSDNTFETVAIPSGDAAMTTIWTTATVPADLNDETDGRERDAGTTLKGGSVIRIVDMLPGASSPMHRTNSIDYGIIISGTIELELDNNIFKTLAAGDIIVQRGTIHKWRNPSAETICRIVFVLTEAKPFELNGTALQEYMEH
ncbi:cupin domain-containing protein [Panacibacter ginsenosidivorans]|uniref:Cupin domain-containing protein n=1 Tax=Panacibacter ginsenosidivorans TaxID=1813871 RepID=A0A5B8V7R3_9BACT|nr:cupin domain-containing protein [Panacibacter ginsenosidivorans]QEC66851.1 cupin domain-containing protein [Panacibacter ginsenosidivorans]